MTSIQTLNGGLSRTADAVDKEVGSKNHNSAQSNRSEYERLTVDQLRKLLKRRSLKQQGNKSDLIKRLLESDSDSNTKSTSMSSSTKSPRARGRSRSPSRSRVVSEESHEHVSSNGESPVLSHRLGVPNGSHDASAAKDTRSRSHSSGGILGVGVLRHRTHSGQLRAAKQREEEIDAKVGTLAVWRTPLQTLRYFVCEVGFYLKGLAYRVSDWSSLFTQRNIAIFAVLTLLYLIVHLGGLQERLEWYGYWCLLGILSSIGLGTGLHTFLLYLGPFIARVTIAAFECGTVNFLEPPFPYDIVCPEADAVAAAASNDSQSIAGEHTAAYITLWTLMGKVRWEAICWGAGTAIGELPPYFVSRSARMAGSANEAEFEEEIRQLEIRVNEKLATPFERAQFFVYNVIRRVGFWGILVCASIPNPLFDLAGITCGHFLIPFGTFFGATLIGKAVVKMHLQKMFVIIAFSEHHVDLVLDWTARIPFVGVHIREPIARYLSDQRAKFHGKVVPTETWFQVALTWFVYAIIAFFVLSIVNSLARANYRRELEAQENDSESERDESSAKKRADRKAEQDTAAASPSSYATAGNHSRSRSNRNRVE